MPIDSFPGYQKNAADRSNLREYVVLARDDRSVLDGICVHFLSLSVYFRLSQGLVDIDCLLNEEQYECWRNTPVVDDRREERIEYSQLMARPLLSRVAFILLAFCKRLFQWQTKGKEKLQPLSLLGRYLQRGYPMLIYISVQERSVSPKRVELCVKKCGVSYRLLLLCAL